MISSEDVRRVTFDKAMRGYRCDDVDDYLKQVAESMDALAAKNDEMQKNLVVLAQRIDQYRPRIRHACLRIRRQHCVGDGRAHRRRQCFC